MEDILERAREYRALAHLRTVAHYISSEWHRARGARYGVIATVLSALVSSSIFFAVANLVGIKHGGDGIIIEPRPMMPTTLHWAAVCVVAALLVASPIYVGITAYLNDPDQAQRHNRSAAKYFGVKERLDLFILRHSGQTTANSREEVLMELQTILVAIEGIANESITLTDRATNRAAVALNKRTGEG